MNKLLIHMMNAGDVNHKILPGLQKMQKAGQVMPRFSTNTIQNDNIPSAGAVREKFKKDFIAKQAMLKSQAINAALERQGTIRQAEAPQSMGSKVWNVLSHPMTALQYKMPYWSTGRKAPDLPEHFERGNRNPLENAMDIVNPFFYMNEVKGFGQGVGNIASKAVTDPTSISGQDVLGTIMHGVGSFPAVAEVIQGTKLLNPAIKGFSKAYRATPSLSTARRIENATNAAAVKMGYVSGDINGHSYYNMTPDAVKRAMGNEMVNLPKGAYSVDGSMSKNSAPLFWTQAARSPKDFTLVNTGEMQPLNWSGRIGKRISNALPADAESVIPDIANYKKELQDRIDYLRQLNDPQSLFKAAQLEKEGLTSQIVSDLPWLSSVDKRAQSTLKEFLNNYKPTLDAPIMEVNRKTGLGFPMTQIVEENIGNKAGELERLFEQPTIYAVKGNPVSRFPKILGNHVNTRVNDFFLKNNPRLPFIKANNIYNLSKDIFDKNEYEMGGQPCYECGGMYAEGGYYDCPDQEKDPVTGKCSAEVVRGREAAAANKAATADMNAWAKQVAAMDKENARQNAAQTAGQLTFDYDWMQSPVDKADKKAAMAQYKQFFQQNPNVFVPDDTSGYSPEQKYIIASKLKQRLSTPMGSQLAQKKLGVDPRYYDLQRMQSELAPKMGGWNGMRDFLFNVYKEEGGEYDLPQAQWGQFVSPIDMGSIASKVMNFFGLNKQPKIVRTPASAPKRLSIRDPRKIMMTTGQPLRPNSDLVGGSYDSEDLGNLLNAGKRQNLSYNDLMNIAAMGFQETKWNKEAENNIGHTKGSFGGHDQYSDLVGAYLAKMKEADRLKIKDEATRLQVYNGLGKIYPSTEKAYHGFKMKKIYGVPVPKGGIDMRKNPLYGKQVMDIRDNVLRQSPDFMRYMDSVYKAPTPEEYANGGPIIDPQDYIKQQYNEGLDFHTKWLNSPMYKSMINASDPTNAKQITDQRKKRLSAVRFSYSSKPSNQTGTAADADILGNIRVYPLGLKHNVGTHEISHVTDKGPGLDLIPAKDQISILEKAYDKVNLPKYNTNNKEYVDYINRPTETRARLNEIRQEAYKNKLYDPFTQKVNPAIYNKLKNFKFDNSKAWSPLEQLRYAYTDEQILQMLNSISKIQGQDLPQAKQGKIIVDPMGQWAHPGRVTRIPSGNITMQGVPYPVLGVASSGQQDMMHPGQNYNFGHVEYVDEYPMMEDGGLLSKSVTCSNCGWSWQAAEGGSDPMTCHKCGGTAKMQGVGTAYVDSALNANRNLDWVKRLYQKNGPSLQIPGQRGPSTHFMESGDGRVYPTVTMVNGKLTHLPAAGIDPFDYADSTKTYIKFPTDKEATWFGKNYKLGTGVLPEHKNGGYTVVRSNDRKGKTHKVIGPDGTVKYFGDSKLGQHPKDPERKAAFYARHKKNLDRNPYFRAFARKTWAEGGQTPDEREMVNGIADILSQVNDRQNRAQIARQMVKDFNNENVTYNYNDFMEKSSLEYGGQPNLWNMIKMAEGGEMIRRADGSYSQRGLWDNIRANKGSGKKPTKQMLQQERKIKAKNK